MLSWLTGETLETPKFWAPNPNTSQRKKTLNFNSIQMERSWGMRRKAEGEDTGVNCQASNPLEGGELLFENVLQFWTRSPLLCKCSFCQYPQTTREKYQEKVKDFEKRCPLPVLWIVANNFQMRVLGGGHWRKATLGWNKTWSGEIEFGRFAELDDFADNFLSFDKTTLHCRRKLGKVAKTLPEAQRAQALLL